MKYKLKKAHEEGQTEFDSVIEISGLTSEVSIHGLLDHYENTEKALKQQLGQVAANEAQMELAVTELPVLKDIPHDKRNLALSYFGKMAANEQSAELIETCKNTMETYRKHLEEIEKATGIKCLPVVSPIQNG